ncbi:hypothetical protein Selin_1444 [Desulfurispirillum indicum S5]|uniref:Uncharacterized protein n=1 Tax=Desulfurispirillum indicum (strain ATCC BAA-1389 / DSM 22839 / S5) TaxID=653733 RepID=E6W6T5_DESIS|nr:hypothetical protein [Desulfurispirillum indicum]ADU66178.1 hypothetical protein Selin_1444 [Desulfurispirillum indicum S5]
MKIELEQKIVDFQSIQRWAYYDPELGWMHADHTSATLEDFQSHIKHFRVNVMVNYTWHSVSQRYRTNCSPVAINLKLNQITLEILVQTNLEQSGYDGLINAEMDCSCRPGQMCPEPQPDTCTAAVLRDGQLVDASVSHLIAHHHSESGHTFCFGFTEKAGTRNVTDVDAKISRLADCIRVNVNPHIKLF